MNASFIGWEMKNGGCFLLRGALRGARFEGVNVFLYGIYIKKKKHVFFIFVRYDLCFKLYL
jgi:hypothetical protein